MTIKSRLAALENKPAALPALPPLTDTQLQNIIDGSDERGTLTSAQINGFVKGRDINTLTDDELMFIVAG